jgi:hypothetical protein
MTTVKMLQYLELDGVYGDAGFLKKKTARAVCL